MRDIIGLSKETLDLCSAFIYFTEGFNIFDEEGEKVYKTILNIFWASVWKKNKS